MGHYGVRLERSDVLKLSAHPEGPTVRNFLEWCTARRAAGRRIAVDLFCGAGGLSAGLEDAGWVVAASVDHDPRALETHRHNFPGLALDLDLAEQRGRDTLVKLFVDMEVDLVAGGPPCQPFSRAGSSKIRSLVEAGLRDEHDDRKELWSAFLDIALRLRPRAVLMENVPDMGLADDFRAIRAMTEAFERAGYATQLRLVDAWRYGVPQIRKRLILLARRDGKAFEWPSAQAEITTLRDSISDLPGLADTTGAREIAYVAPAKPSSFSLRMRQGATPGVLQDHMTRPVRADDLEIFQMMDSKTLYSEIPDRLRRYKVESFDDKYKRLGWDELSRSITAHIAKDGYWYIHPGEHRTLTVREAARIQTFPDHFRFAGTRSDAFRVIGNAVPPLLGEAAAIALRPDTLPASGPEWLAVRAQLASWAERQRSSTYWFMLPGNSVTAPVALAAAVLSGLRIDPRQVSKALAHLRGLPAVNTVTINAMKKCLEGTAGGRALDRLRPLARRRAVWAEPKTLVEAVDLKPAEQDVFAMLQGDDVLLRSQGPIRVAARIVGSDSAKVNRLTDGRVDLARLVGAGEHAALRMAALRLISITHCGADTQNCADCPLAVPCASAKTNKPELSSKKSG